MKSVRHAKKNKKFDVLIDLYQPILSTMGFEATIIAKALSTGFLDLNKLIDLCVLDISTSTYDSGVGFRNNEPDGATTSSDGVDVGTCFLQDSCRAIGIGSLCSDNDRVEKDERLAKRRACKTKKNIRHSIANATCLRIICSKI